MIKDKAMTDAIASYAGPVTLCRPGKARAPDVEERGRAQFQCRCGHHGTMTYPKLFRRLRRRRKRLRLRCELCGEVLQ